MLDLLVLQLQDYLLEGPFLTCALQNENQAKPTLSENQTSAGRQMPGESVLHTKNFSTCFWSAEHSR